jgi:hypothetical protein
LSVDADDVAFVNFFARICVLRIVAVALTDGAGPLITILRRFVVSSRDRKGEKHGQSDNQCVKRDPHFLIG